jgi:hypothetical protein
MVYSCGGEEWECELRGARHSWLRVLNHAWGQKLWRNASLLFLNRFLIPFQVLEWRGEKEEENEDEKDAAPERLLAPLE